MKLGVDLNRERWGNPSVTGRAKITVRLGYEPTLTSKQPITSHLTAEEKKEP